ECRSGGGVVHPGLILRFELGLEGGIGVAPQLVRLGEARPPSARRIGDDFRGSGLPHTGPIGQLRKGLHAPLRVARAVSRTHHQGGCQKNRQGANHCATVFSTLPSAAPSSPVAETNAAPGEPSRAGCTTTEIFCPACSVWGRHPLR